MALNKGFFRILLFWGISSVFALSAEESQAKLKAILLKHQALIPFHSQFEQIKTVKEMGIDLSSEGELEVSGKGHATWKILKPSFLSVEISPEAIKIFNDPKGTPRVINKSAANGSEFEGSSWMKLLMENPESAMKNFNITEIAKNRFKLLPLDKKEGFDSLELAFKENSQIDEVLIQENTDDTLKIKFHSIPKATASLKKKSK